MSNPENIWQIIGDEIIISCSPGFQFIHPIGLQAIVDIYLC